jgi:hypothetical protein
MIIPNMRNICNVGRIMHFHIYRPHCQAQTTFDSGPNAKKNLRRLRVCFAETSNVNMISKSDCYLATHPILIQYMLGRGTSHWAIIGLLGYR